MRCWHVYHRGLAIVAVMGTACGAICAKPAEKPAPKYTRTQEIAWHLDQAQELKDQGKIDEAKIHWREVLRLDPNNQEAALGLDTALLDGVHIPRKNAAAKVVLQQADLDKIGVDVRAAIKTWVNADDIAGVGDILEDRTADPLGKRLLRAYRMAIMKVDGGISGPDTQLFDEFESYIDSNNLSQVANEVDDGIIASDLGRPYGRNLIESVQKWERRSLYSGIEMGLVRPFGIDHAARNLDKVKLTVVTPTLVLIDDADFDDPVPLEARFEDGKWRIGARPGSKLFYDVKIGINGTHKQYR